MQKATGQFPVASRFVRASLARQLHGLNVDHVGVMPVALGQTCADQAGRGARSQLRRERVEKLLTVKVLVMDFLGGRVDPLAAERQLGQCLGRANLLAPRAVPQGIEKRPLDVIPVALEEILRDPAGPMFCLPGTGPGRTLSRLAGNGTRAKAALRVHPAGTIIPGLTFCRLSAIVEATRRTIYPCNRPVSAPEAGADRPRLALATLAEAFPLLSAGSALKSERFCRTHDAWGRSLRYAAITGAIQNGSQDSAGR